MIIRGRQAENAILKASRHYALVDRGEVARQHTPQNKYVGYSAKAPIDFRGWFGADRQPCGIECKETAEQRIKFSDDKLKQSQVDAMRDSVRRNIQHWLIVDFSTEGETYRIDAKHVVEFADKPWRSSLSLFWCRAFGELCKVSDRDTDKMAIWWLDTVDHHEKEIAGLAVAAEKARAEGRTVELYPASGLRHGKRDDKFRELMARKPGRDATDLERLRWHGEMSSLTLERDIAEAKRLQARAPKKRRGGWMP